MYGNCDVCGKRFGTTEDGVWHEPCEHMQKMQAVNKLEEILKKSKGGKINRESFWKKEKESFDKIQEDCEKILEVT